MLVTDNEIIKSEGRLFAIGDVHGRGDVLRELLAAIEPRPSDVFVFLGDLINRGPFTKQVIEQVLTLSDKCDVHVIKGNHEEMFIEACEGSTSELKRFLQFGGDKMLRSYGVGTLSALPSEHSDLLRNKTKDCVESSDHLFTHAGYLPFMALSATPDKILRWDFMDNVPEPHMSGKIVIYGHSSMPAIKDSGHAICIDTSCGVDDTKGMLTALEVNTRKVWQTSVLGGTTQSEI